MNSSRVPGDGLDGEGLCPRNSARPDGQGRAKRLSELASIFKGVCCATKNSIEKSNQRWIQLRALTFECAFATGIAKAIDPARR